MTGWRGSSPNSGRRWRRRKRSSSSTASRTTPSRWPTGRTSPCRSWRTSTPPTRAKTERIQKQALYKQLQASQSDPSRLDTFPAILANPFVQEQKGQLATLQRHAGSPRRLGAKHPDMIKLTSAMEQTREKLAVEIEKIVQSVRSEHEAAQYRRRA